MVTGLLPHHGFIGLCGDATPVQLSRLRTQGLVLEAALGARVRISWSPSLPTPFPLSIALVY